MSHRSASPSRVASFAAAAFGLAGCGAASFGWWLPAGAALGGAAWLAVLAVLVMPGTRP